MIVLISKNIQNFNANYIIEISLMSCSLYIIFRDFDIAFFYVNYYINWD